MKAERETVKFDMNTKGVAALAMAVALTGCAVKAPPYDPSINNVTVLKRSGGNPVSLGAFTVAAAAKGASSISLRGSPLQSPVGDNYAAYLADAIKKELDLAKLLNTGSKLEVSGSLIGTDVDTAMGTASGYIEARFVVKKDGQVTYDKTQRGSASWESSFIGAIAIPAAQQNYPRVVQDLLAKLYSDVEFQSALK